MKNDRIALLLLLTVLLSGCATTDKVAVDLAAAPQQPRSLYIVTQRNQRLPAEFIDVLKQVSEQRLPGAQITVDENTVDDQALAGADWVIALRATRIKPNHFNQPTDNSVVNGMTDCVVGAAVIGVFYNPIAPCIYSADFDFLEASVRDAGAKTVKTYQARQDGEGWMWPIPFTAIKNLFSGDDDQQQVWKELINTLYDKMLRDRVFDNGLPLASTQE
jgi:outer membrane murein-binding lipoprotein Lpp